MNVCSVVVRAGYLVCTAAISSSAALLTGDLNQTTLIEVICGAPRGCSSMSFNGQEVATTTDAHGVITGTVTFEPPIFSLPNLTEQERKRVNSLPEVEPDYNDSAWSSADHVTTMNPRGLHTPTSLHGSEYDFNTGSLLFRGRFIATGK